MAVAAGELQELHRLLLKLEDIEDQLKKGPRKIKAKENNTKAKEEALEQAKQHQQDCRKTADQKSLDLKSKETQINDLKGKLNTVKTNREFDTIKGQIESETVAMGAIEDEILSTLENVDAATQAIKDAEEDLNQAKVEEKQARDDFSAKAAELETQAAELKTQITEAEGILTGQNKEQYRRVIGQKGAEALAAVENGVCTGCYVGLTPQNKIRLNTGEVIFCKQCASLLYPASE